MQLACPWHISLPMPFQAYIYLQDLLLKDGELK